MNQKYLSPFLKVIKDKAEIPLPNFSEEQLSTTVIHKEKLKIDLLLYLPDGYTMIIENKIKAGDQPAQLKKYFNIIANERRRDKKKIFIVYLTLDGHEPSEQSKGELEHDIIYLINLSST